MLKTCTACKEEKEVGEFHIDRSTKDGHQYKCKECERKYGASVKYEIYHNGGWKEQIQLARKFINSIAAAIGCEDCREHFYKNPECLTFDHVRGTKKFIISTWGGYSLKSSVEQQSKVMKRLQDELKKCSIICHNCHAIRTKRDWYKHNQAHIDRQAAEREKLINA